MQTITYTKTKAMIFHTSVYHAMSYHIHTGGNIFLIEKSLEWSLIKEFTWKYHIKAISSHISSTVGIIDKCQNLLNCRWLLSLQKFVLLAIHPLSLLDLGMCLSNFIRQNSHFAMKALKHILGLELRTSSRVVLQNQGP